jgi:hypothetical protein
MQATSGTEELIVLTHADYLRLKHDLKEARLDLCYSAQVGQPLRLDWSLGLFMEDKFRQYLAEHRPADASYCIVSVQHVKKGGWFRPDEFILTFHTVGVRQSDDLRQYLREHDVQSSPEATKAKLGDL